MCITAKAGEIEQRKDRKDKSKTNGPKEEIEKSSPPNQTHSVQNFDGQEKDGRMEMMKEQRKQLTH